MAAKDFIVAIELGSSKVTGIAGRKNLDGSISVGCCQGGIVLIHTQGCGV